MIYFLIPVYNESANIGRLAQSLLNVFPEEDKYYVFVDDCSSDDTIAIVEQHFAGRPLQVIRKETNLGPGDSFNRGFEWILENSKDPSDAVITIEGDNTSDPGIMPHMLVVSRLGYQLVLASIYAQGGGFDQTSFFRKTASLFANMFIRYFFDIKVLTLSSFYRIYHVSLLKKIRQRFGIIIAEKGFISMVEVLVKAIHVEAKIIEVPMKMYSARRVGKSKMKVFRTFVSYLKFLLRKP